MKKMCLISLFIFVANAFAMCPVQMPSKAIINKINKAYNSKSTKPTLIDAETYFKGGMLVNWTDSGFYAYSKIDTGKDTYNLKLAEKTEETIKFTDSYKSLYLSEKYTYCEKDSLSLKHKTEFKLNNGILELKLFSNMNDTLIVSYNFVQEKNKMKGYIIMKDINDSVTEENNADSVISKGNYYIDKKLFPLFISGKKDSRVEDGEICEEIFRKNQYGNTLNCTYYKDGKIQANPEKPVTAGFSFEGNNLGLAFNVCNNLEVIEETAKKQYASFIKVDDFFFKKNKDEICLSKEDASAGEVLFCFNCKKKQCYGKSRLWANNELGRISSINKECEEHGWTKTKGFLNNWEWTCYINGREMEDSDCKNFKKQ